MEFIDITRWSFQISPCEIGVAVFEQIRYTPVSVSLKTNTQHKQKMKNKYEKKSTYIFVPLSK